MAYRDSLDQIIENVQKTGSDIDLTPFIAISQQIREAEVSGRVIIDILESNNEQLLIQDGDTLIIPEKGSQVYVYGAVTSAGSVKYKANEPIDYYLKRKGGLNSNADKKNIYIGICNNNIKYILGMNNIVYIVNNSKCMIQS